jgi:hypothetical protein
MDLNVILRGMWRRLPVQAKAVGKNNVDKVPKFFVKATLDGKFCNTHDWLF